MQVIVYVDANALGAVTYKNAKSCKTETLPEGRFLQCTIEKEDGIKVTYTSRNLMVIESE